MKITFIDPPALSKKQIPERVLGCNYGLYPIPNIFLLTAAAVLERIDSKVKYLSCPLEGMSRDEFKSFLKKNDSDCYVVYSVNLAKSADVQAARLIREVKGKIQIVFMGPGPTYDPNSYLLDERVYVVRGEPELTLLELVKNNFVSLPKIKGITYVEKGKILSNEPQELISDLDWLPFPARHLVNQKDYHNPKLGLRPFTAMLTARGCPFRCVYCVPCSLNFAREIEYKREHDNKKPPIRRRSAENVIQEFKLLKDEGYKAVSILDDEYVLNKERAVQISKGIKDLGIRWGCLARADTLTEEVVRNMSEAGCKYIDIGVESFDQEILDYIQKGIKAEVIENAVSLVKKYGITAKINILFGCSPYETKDTINYTLKMVKKIRPDLVMFGICNPFPGTEYYKTAKKNKWFVNGDYYPVDVQKESVISYPNLSKKDLEKAVKRANYKFFLSPGFVYRQLRKTESLGDIVKSLGSLKRKLF